VAPAERLVAFRRRPCGAVTAAGTQPSVFETVNVYFERAAMLTDDPRGLLDQIKPRHSVYAFQFRSARGAAARWCWAGGPSTTITGSPSRAGSASPPR